MRASLRHQLRRLTEAPDFEPCLRHGERGELRVWSATGDKASFLIARAPSSD